jgi:O-antigen/teichoic acid export membrane protein
MNPTSTSAGRGDAANGIGDSTVERSTTHATKPDSDRGVAPGVASEQGSANAALPRSAVIWSYALTVGRFVMTGVVTIFMTSYLQPADYGVMALAMVWVTFAQTLALHGTGQAVIQRDEVDQSHLDAAFWTTVGGSLLLAALFAVAAPLWAALNGTPKLVPVCLILSPAILLNALVVVPDAILRRQLKFQTLSLRVLIAGILSGIAGIAAAVNGYGVWALVIQQMVLTTFGAIAVWAAVPWRPGFRHVGRALRDIRSYSLHSLSGFFAYFISSRSDALLLGPVFGPVAIGLYRFASRITAMVNEVAVSGLSQVSMPHLSRLAPDRERFADAVARILRGGTLIALPAFGILFAVGPWLLAWIGPQWTDASPGFQMLCLGSAALAVTAIVSAILQAAGRPGTVATIGWCTAVTTIASMFAAGRVYASHSARTEVLAISVTYTVIQGLSVVLGVVVMFRSVLRSPLWAGLRPSLPPTAAGLAAAVTGLAIQHLFAGGDPFAGLVLAGGSSSVVAAVVLFTTDAEVFAQVRLVCGRTIRTLRGNGKRRDGVARASAVEVAGPGRREQRGRHRLQQTNGRPRGSATPTEPISVSNAPDQ